MTRATRTTMLLVAALIAACAACTGCGDGAAPAAPAKGKANLRVIAVAVPKPGVKAFAAYQSDEARAATAAQSTGDRELVDYEQLEDVVVWLERADGTGAAAAAKAGSAERRIPVTSKPAKPPLFAATVGETAAFENNGSRPLRLYSVSEGNEFNLGQLAPGAAASHRFQSPGLIELLDGEALDVVAHVYVAAGQDPRVTSSGQPVVYRDLEPGPWRALAWHGRLPGGERAITLVPDGVREIHVPIGVNALPKVE